MNIAISTGTFYKVPFVKTLEMIKESGLKISSLEAHDLNIMIHDEKLSARI